VFYLVFSNIGVFPARLLFIRWNIREQPLSRSRLFLGEDREQFPPAQPMAKPFSPPDGVPPFSSYFFLVQCSVYKYSSFFLLRMSGQFLLEGRPLGRTLFCFPRTPNDVFFSLLRSALGGSFPLFAPCLVSPSDPRQEGQAGREGTGRSLLSLSSSSLLSFLLSPLLSPPPPIVKIPAMRPPNSTRRSVLLPHRSLLDGICRLSL